MPKIASDLGIHESTAYAWAKDARDKSRESKPEQPAVENGKQLVLVPEQQRQYLSEEQKKEIARLYRSKEATASQLAVKFNTTAASVYAWANRYSPTEQSITAYLEKPAPTKAIEEIRALTDKLGNEQAQRRASALLTHLSDEVRGMKKAMEWTLSILTEAEKSIKERLEERELGEEDEAHLYAKLARRMVIKKLRKI